MEKKKTVVVALGHRALGSTLPEQKTATREAAKAIADLIEMNCNVVVTHGSGVHELSHVSLLCHEPGIYRLRSAEFDPG